MRYAIITDIHEDLISLERALKKIEKEHCSEIVCLGDISGFSVPHYSYVDSRNARECLRLVRENCSIIVAGNHDLHAARITPQNSPEYAYPPNWYDLDYWERQQLSENKVWLYEKDELCPMYAHSDIEFICSLPEFQILKTDMGNILLTHFVFPNITGSAKIFYFEEKEFDSHRTFLKEQNCQFGVAGHRHFSGLYVVSDKILSKRFGKKIELKAYDIVLTPPIARNQSKSGFCILDSEQCTIEAIKI